MRFFDFVVLAVMGLYIGVAVYERHFGRALLSAWILALVATLTDDGVGISGELSRDAFLALSVLGFAYMGFRTWSRRQRRHLSSK